MGYISRDIAVITGPTRVSLSGLPNFLRIESKPSTPVYLEIDIQVLSPTVNTATIRLTTPDGAIYNFTATSDADKVTGSVFLLGADASVTAGNIRKAMLLNTWISSNFDIFILPSVVSGVTTNGAHIRIKSKGAGTDYNITITKPADTGGTAYLITQVVPVSALGDSISGESSTAEIEVEVYSVNSLFLGENDAPTTREKLGDLILTMQKTYAGAPMWFDISSVFANYRPYNLPIRGFGWFNAGTCGMYRLIASVEASNFYYSKALCIVNGYGSLLDIDPLAGRVYLDSTIQLLTNKPRTTYMRGQREYLNFIAEDPQRGVAEPIDYALRVLYRAYATGGDYLGSMDSDPIERAALNIVNTCALNIDALLDAYPGAGEIKVNLARGSAAVSNSLEYRVLPDCLHVLNPITFLNKLGGWDTYNFDATLQDEIKPTTDTYNRTVTPVNVQEAGDELMHSVSLEDTITIEGSPCTDEVADWLKELATARVLLDKDGNYLVRDDFQLKKTSSAFNMQVPTLKYHLSATYTNE